MRKLSSLLILLSLLVVAAPGQAVNVTIDPGNFTGTWDMDFDGTFRTGVQVLDLAGSAAGTPHILRPGGSAQIRFWVYDDGTTAPLNPDLECSMTGGPGVMTLKTIAVPVDPGAYAGEWQFNRINPNTTGAQTVNLVPHDEINQLGEQGAVYNFNIGLVSSSVAIVLPCLGNMTILYWVPEVKSDAVFDDAGTLRFRNETISITDTDGSGLPWFIRSVTGTLQGNQNLVLVPGVQYDLSISESNAFFVDIPCDVSPPFITTGSQYRFDISCAVDELSVTIDIKPGSDPNSINLCSNGAVPIAIFGSATFDVNEINTETLRFAEAAVKVVGKKDPNQLCSYEDVDGDSFTDLVCHFVTQDIAGIDGESTTANLNGELLNGTAIEGTDSVNIVKDTCN